VRARTARQQGCGVPERIAARAFDVDDFGAEFGELGTDIGLRDEDAGADRAEPFERAERRNEARCRRSLEAPEP